MVHGVRRFVPQVLLGAMIAIWGGSYAVVKASLGSLSPFAIIALRFWIATSCLLPFALASGGRWRATAGPGIAAGIVLALGYTLQTVGMQETSASMGGLLAGLIVPLVAVGGHVVFGARLGSKALLGLALAMVGIALLCWPDSTHQDTARGIALQIGSSTSYAAHVLLLSHFGRSMPVAPFCTWQLGIVAVAASACWAVAGDAGPVQWDLRLVLLVAYLGFLATALGIAVQSRVQHRIPATHVAMLFALQPLFAAFFGWLTLGERLGAMQLGGGAAIVAGVVTTGLDRVRSVPATAAR